MSESRGEKLSLGQKVRRFAAVALATIPGFTGGCAPTMPPVENQNKASASADLPNSTTELTTTTITPISDQQTVPTKESRYIEPHQATQEDKQVFLTTLEKYINLDAEPKLKAQLDNPLFDEQFKVVVVDKPIHPLPAHTAYTFGNVQLSVVKDTKGQVSEENLLIGQVAKESLKIQPPNWEPIQSVNLNGKITSLGITAEFSPSAGNYLRYQKFNNGQLSIAWRNIPFPK